MTHFYVVNGVYSDGEGFRFWTDAKDSSEALVNIASHVNEVRYGRPERTALRMSARLATREEHAVRADPYGMWQMDEEVKREALA